MALLTRLRTARTALGLGRSVRPEPVRRGGEVPESVAIIMDGTGAGRASATCPWAPATAPGRGP